MRHLFAASTLLFLILAFVTSSPLILGLCLLAAFICSVIAVFAYAQAKIDAKQQNEVYIPTAAELELMRKAELRRRAAQQSKADSEQAE